MFWKILGILLVAYISHKAESLRRCPFGEVWSEEASLCPPTCDVRYSPCDGFSPGCECIRGFIRDPSTRRCIHLSQCPEKVCPRGEVWNECGSSCPPQCGDSGFDCPAVCVPGCFCKPGLVRNPATGRCIPPSECQIEEFECPRGEVWNECGSSCPPQCGDSGSFNCPDVCVPGCFCKPGLVRNPATRQCISPFNCPPTVCPEGQIPTQCNWCPRSCSTLHLDVCTQECWPDRIQCRCPPGQVFNDAVNCVDIDEC